MYWVLHNRLQGYHTFCIWRLEKSPLTFAPKNARMSKKQTYFNIVETADACHIYIYGYIGEWDDEVRALDISRELVQAEMTGKRIVIRINSMGGEVYTGIAIFNALMQSKGDVSIQVDGIAASMASVIALCGKPVQMSKYARLMIHSVSGWAHGNKVDIQRHLQEIDSLENTLAEMYAKRMGKSPEDVKAQYFDGSDHWLTADEALALGLVDGIYDIETVDAQTSEEIYTIFNNRVPKRERPKRQTMSYFEQFKNKYDRFKNVASDDEVHSMVQAIIGEAETVSAENADLKKRVEAFESEKAEAIKAEKTALLDAAVNDGRIDVPQREVYQAILDADFENGKKVLAGLKPQRNVKDDLNPPTNSTGSAWEDKMKKIRENRK